MDLFSIIYSGAVFLVVKLPKSPIFLQVTPINSVVYQARAGWEGCFHLSSVLYVESIGLLTPV